MGNLIRQQSGEREKWYDAASGAHLECPAQGGYLRRLLRLVRHINGGVWRIASVDVHESSIFLKPVKSGSGSVKYQTRLFVEDLQRHSLEELAEAVQRNFENQRRRTELIVDALKRSNRGQAAKTTEGE